MASSWMSRGICSKTPLGLWWLRRGGGYAYQTTSGHGAKHVQSSHVSPEEGCYNVYVWFVQDRLSHRLHWLHDWDCGLVVWVCTADHLEDEEEASGGGQRHDTTTWAAYTAWLGYARTRVLGRYVNHHAARRDRV